MFFVSSFKKKDGWKHIACIIQRESYRRKQYAIDSPDIGFLSISVLYIIKGITFFENIQIIQKKNKKYKTPIMAVLFAWVYWRIKYSFFVGLLAISGIQWWILNRTVWNMRDESTFPSSSQIPPDDEAIREKPGLIRDI